jgi:hypothetical protein
VSAASKFTTAVAYIYFDYKDPKSYALENIIRSLLKQLLLKLLLLPQELESLYDECKREGKSADASTLKKHLLSACSHFKSAIVLFDALDECNNFKETANIISELKKTGVKVFCTSRIDTPQVREKLQNPTVVEIQADQEDVFNYISTRLDKEWDYDEGKQEIVDALVNNAEGKFYTSQFCS